MPSLSNRRKEVPNQVQQEIISVKFDIVALNYIYTANGVAKQLTRRYSYYDNSGAPRDFIVDLDYSSNNSNGR